MLKPTQIPEPKLELKLRAEARCPHCNYPLERLPEKPTRCTNCFAVLARISHTPIVKSLSPWYN